MKSSTPRPQGRDKNPCQHGLKGHSVTYNVTDEDLGGEVYRLRLENDRLLFEVKSLRIQRDNLIESNRQLKEQLDHARQMEFSPYGNCQECGKQLPPREDTGRDRKYCSDKCKMKAYRRRKRMLRKRDEYPGEKISCVR